MSEEINTTAIQGTTDTSASRPDQSYWAIVKRQFKKNRLAVWSLRVVYLIVFLGLMADFIANDKPLYCKYKGTTYYPVLKSYAVDWGLSKWPEELALVDWKDLEYESVIWPPVPYSPSEMDIYNVQYVGPFDEQRIESDRWKHWMGTDAIGRDVLSGMIHGTRIAMLVGIISMFIASTIGILLGALAGFFGDEKLKISRISLVLNIPFLFIAYYFSFSARGYILADAFGESMWQLFVQFHVSLLMFIAIMLIPFIIARLFRNVEFLSKEITIPMDIIVSRLIEVVISIPKLLLILAIVAIAKPSIFLVMVIIGATGWTGIARLLRAELLRVRSLEYIEAADSLGYSNARIVLKHAIPNSLTPVLIAIAFGIAGAILIESSLSFLGIGVQAEVITWGKLLSIARSAPEAWWLAIFPGFAIFITVTIFNLLGDGLSDALDPRLKS